MSVSRSSLPPSSSFYPSKKGDGERGLFFQCGPFALAFQLYQFSLSSSVRLWNSKARPGEISFEYSGALEICMMVLSEWKRKKEEVVGMSHHGICCHKWSLLFILWQRKTLQLFLPLSLVNTNTRVLFRMLRSSVQLQKDTTYIVQRVCSKAFALLIFRSRELPLRRTLLPLCVRRWHFPEVAEGRKSNFFPEQLSIQEKTQHWNPEGQEEATVFVIKREIRPPLFCN